LNRTASKSKKDSRELPASVARQAIRKSVPWVLGAAAGLAATLLIRKLIRRNKRKRLPLASRAISTISKSPVAGKVSRSLAVQLLPIAGLLLKNWISKKRLAKNQAVNRV